MVTCVLPGMDQGTSDTYALPLVAGVAESRVRANGEDTKADVAGNSFGLSGAEGLFEQATTRAMAAKQGTARPYRVRRRARRHEVAAVSPSIRRADIDPVLTEHRAIATVTVRLASWRPSDTRLRPST